MKRPGKIFFALTVLVAVIPAHAGPARLKGAKAAKLQEKLYWYDGGKRREAWVDPSLVAEFDPKAETETQVKSASPGTEILGKPGEFIRIWKGGAGTKSLSRDLSKLPSGKFSPVFRDHPDGQGAVRALPGGIVVVFDPAWDFQKISEWASGEKVEVLDKLPIGKNAYIVQSEPGLAALELANRLQESGKVKSASPDWWRQVEPN